MGNNTEESCAVKCTENHESGDHRGRNIGKYDSKVRDLNRALSATAQRLFIPRGIKNSTGTCYIKAALQCLLAMDNIRERYAKPWDQLSLHISNLIITNQIWNLFYHRCPLMEPPGAFELTGPSPAPTQLQQNIFNGQDKGQSAPAILEIVRGLADEQSKLENLQGGSEIIRSPIFEDFITSFQTKVTCCICRSERSLPVKNVGMLEMNLPDYEIYRSLKLGDLLPFMEIQNMRKNHKISMCCQRCKCPWIDGTAPASCPATFEISIKKSPRLLVVFWMAENGRRLAHLSNKIELETYLDLGKFASRNRPENYQYRLIAVADFQAPVDPAKPGHTSAFILGSKYGQDKWIHFDDEVVTPGIEESQVLNVTHWVSVYEREDNEIDLNKLPNYDEGC